MMSFTIKPLLIDSLQQLLFYQVQLTSRLFICAHRHESSVQILYKLLTIWVRFNQNPRIGISLTSITKARWSSDIITEYVSSKLSTGKVRRFALKISYPDHLQSNGKGIIYLFTQKFYPLTKKSIEYG